MGHPSKFQRVSRLGFIAAVTSLTGHQSNFARCLAVSCARTLYIHFRGLSCPLTEFRHVQNSLCVQVLRSPILAALLHGSPAEGSAKLCGVVQGTELRNFHRGRPLYSAGRPSRWASAHILVEFIFFLHKFHIDIDFVWHKISGRFYAPAVIQTGCNTI